MSWISEPEKGRLPGCWPVTGLVSWESIQLRIRSKKLIGVEAVPLTFKHPRQHFRLRIQYSTEQLPVWSSNTSTISNRR